MVDRSELASSSCPSPSSLAHDVITVFQFHNYAVEHNITDMEQHLLDLAKESKRPVWIDRLSNWNRILTSLFPNQSRSQRPWAAGMQNAPLRNYRKCPSPLSSPALKLCGPWLGCWPQKTPTWARPPVPFCPPLPRTNPAGQRSVLRITYQTLCSLRLTEFHIVCCTGCGLLHARIVRHTKRCMCCSELLTGQFETLIWVHCLYRRWFISLPLSSSLGLFLGCRKHRRCGVTVWLDWWRTSSGRHRNPSRFW